MSNNNKLKDKDILQKILDHYRYTASALAKDLGMTPTALYHIMKRNYNISNDLRDKLQIKFPDLNYLFLYKGEGEVTVNKGKVQAQQNLINNESKTLDGIYGALKNIEDLLTKLVEQKKESN